MKKRFKLEGLDCPNCAEKMEDSIKKIEGVKEATVSFFTEKLTIEAEEKDFEKIIEEAIKRIAHIDSDCKVLK